MTKTAHIFIFIFSFILFSNNVKCNSKSDSLKNLLLTAKNDTVRKDLLHELGNELILKNHIAALESYFQSKELAEELKDTSDIVYNIIGICDVYSMMGEYKQALNFVSEALKIAQGNYDLMASCHSRLAIEYFQIKEYNLSIKNDLLSLEYNTLLKDTLKIAYDLHNIGTYYLGIGETDSAIHYYNTSNEFLSNKNDVLASYNNSRIGFAHSYGDKYTKALEFHLKALEMFESDSLLFEMALEENYIASIHFNLRNFDLSFKHAHKALKLTEELNNHDLYKMNYHLLYDLHDYNKEYKEALKYALLEAAYADSLEEKNKESVIQSIETKHNFIEQEKLLEVTEESNQILARQKLQLIIFGGISFLLLVTSIIILIFKRIEHRKNIQLVEELDYANQSIKKILSIIGHDLRDSVGNLKNFTQLLHLNLLDKKSIQNMLQKFVPMVDSTYDLLDNLLIWSRNNEENFKPNMEIFTSKEIVEITNNHISHLAETKQIKLHKNIENTSLKADKNMLLTVLRNLISNAIKFSEPGSSIYIETLTKDSMVVFTVRDEGVGMNSEELEKVLDENINRHSVGTIGERGSGLGLSLCNSFINKHGGTFNVNSKLGVGSSFSFSIPQNMS